jgi:hypothetical protein
MVLTLGALIVMVSVHHTIPPFWALISRFTLITGSTVAPDTEMFGMAKINANISSVDIFRLIFNTVLTYNAYHRFKP